MDELTESLKEMALTLGAFKVGIATTETLAGGPPSADLTYVLPEEENYCDGCKLCLSVGSSGFVDPVEKVTVTLGGREFSYGKRKSYARCGYVCGGMSGLNPSGKWSTWSPACFAIPEKAKEYLEAMPPERRKLYESDSEE
jgi:epoxyqueuosine reductase QueG